jgi:hypothetical protein
MKEKDLSALLKALTEAGYEIKAFCPNVVGYGTIDLTITPIETDKNDAGFVCLRLVYRRISRFSAEEGVSAG